MHRFHYTLNRFVVDIVFFFAILRCFYFIRPILFNIQPINSEIRPILFSIRPIIGGIRPIMLSIRPIHYKITKKHSDRGRSVVDYIFSGAATPIRRSAFAIVWRADVTSARRASDKATFSAFSTLSAL